MAELSRCEPQHEWIKKGRRKKIDVDENMSLARLLPASFSLL
jgi:hypothetical protein